MTEVSLASIEAELAIYADLLRRWQRRINLIGPSTVSSMRARHFEDSSAVVQFAPLEARWADLGSGAGFPGMIVALLQKPHPGAVTHLIEADRRKAAFLREVSRETGARAEIHVARAEDVLDAIAPNIITSRAMAPLRSLIEICDRRIRCGAKCVFLKGQNIEDELTALTISSNFLLKVDRSPTNELGYVATVELAL